MLRRIRRFYPAQEAEDVLQEVFVRAMEKLGTFRGDSSPVTWLYQLTTRHCLNRLRDEKRRTELWDAHGDMFWAPAVTEPAQERNALLKQLWRTLDEEIVLIGIYYHLDGMSHAEIAEIVGVSRRTVGNRLAELEAAARKLSA
jgi:RNA polymerase sigma-70 factor (ECF subfamily)